MKKNYRQGDAVLCALPADRYVNKPGVIRPGTVVRVDESGTYVQAILADGDYAGPAHAMNFYGVPAAGETDTPGAIWPNLRNTR